jgi:hypothetical protein
MHVATAPPQVDNRIPHQLPRPVERHIAAAIRFHDPNSRIEHVCPALAPADGVDRRMFRQEKRLRNRSRCNPGSQALLDGEGFGEIDGAEVPDPHMPPDHTSIRTGFSRTRLSSPRNWAA